MTDLVVYPALSSQQIACWNRLLLLAADLCRVPSALIMQVSDNEIAVAASAETGQTPYKVGDKEHLNIGLYCEHVMESRAMLCVPDATVDPAWRNNPDIKLGMISYLGYPVCWPDGTIFGTICLLDRIENHYLNNTKELMVMFQGVVQDQLALVFEKARLEDTLNQLQDNRAQLTEAVKIAVEKTVQKNHAINSIARDFANVLDELAGSLVMISELPEHHQVQYELTKIVDEVNETAERLMNPMHVH